MIREQTSYQTKHC